MNLFTEMLSGPSLHRVHERCFQLNGVNINLAFPFHFSLTATFGTKYGSNTSYW